MQNGVKAAVQKALATVTVVRYSPDGTPAKMPATAPAAATAGATALPAPPPPGPGTTPPASE